MPKRLMGWQGADERADKTGNREPRLRRPRTPRKPFVEAGRDDETHSGLAILRRRGRLITNVEMRRVDATTSVAFRIETALEHPADEQCALDRVGCAAGLDHFLDLVHQARRIGDVGLGGKRNCVDRGASEPRSRRRRCNRRRHH